MKNVSCGVLRVGGMTVERRVEPLGVDEARPRFSWTLEASGRGAVQSAWQVQAAESEADLRAGRLTWDSGRVASATSLDVPWGGGRLRARRRYWWRVRVWDGLGRGSDWSRVTWFETGRLGERWRSGWIALPPKAPVRNPPAVFFRTRFQVRERVVSARWYVTALGVVEPWCNGRRVGDDVLAPGWSDFRKRVDYLVYDVTPQVLPGRNVLGMVVGDGWYSGFRGPPECEGRYGEFPQVSAELVLTLASGREQRVITGPGWEARTGPVLENSIYHGEVHDARRELAGWCAAAAAQRVGWRRAKVMPPVEREIRSKPCPPIRRREEVRAVSVKRRPGGGWVLDFGVNLVGWARLSVTAPRGTRVTLRFAEMLESDGSLHTANLRGARATDTYVCAGGGPETWEPRFTFHGFRYVEVSGLPGRVSRNTVTAVGLTSDLAPAGGCVTSDERVNRLLACIERGRLGNFLDLPTDCPQRDERLGWTGDIQVFAPTACYLSDCAAFLRQWMRSMRDGQRADGAFPDIAPAILGDMGNAGWSDAGVIVPWVVWRFTGDTRIVEENYAAMARHVRFLERTSPGGIRAKALYGDWLSPDAVVPQFAPTPKELIGTAYFARVADLLARMAGGLGRRADAARWGVLASRVRRAFQREFVTPSGRLAGDTQTGYAMALGFGLLPEALRPAAVRRLVELVDLRDGHLTTGFLGTPLLNPVLSAGGRRDVAYRLLLQETYPGWLYPVLQGATTMWERWNSWTRDKGFADGDMNSFNHYAYGAIGEWLFGAAAGIRPGPGGVASREFEVAPEPGGGLTRVSAFWTSAAGPVRSSWRRTRGRMDLEVTIPANAIATVVLPARSGVTESGRRPDQRPGVLSVTRDAGGTRIRVGSGTYRFACPLAPDPVRPKPVSGDILKND